jgi:hypothetical protein
MRNPYSRAVASWLVLAAVSWLGMDQSSALAENSPPEVSIVWPHQNDSFSAGTLVKVKADATDPDGTIAQVQFFTETNLIGIATHAPYNIVWYVEVRGAPYGTWNLKAVAVDDLGTSRESAPVTVEYYTGAGSRPVVEIVSPRDGSVFAAPASFAFTAELLASPGDQGPLEFFVGTNSVGVVDQDGFFEPSTLPSSIAVTNLLEGEHKLTVRYRGVNGFLCACNKTTSTIKVANLAVRSPSVTREGRFQFEVVTSFPGRPTVIECSPNLHDWNPVSTNYPTGNNFIFSELLSSSNLQRFYRIIVPPE